MCGICGQIAIGQRRDAGLVARLQAALAHRGPDDAGAYVDGPVELAMRRLSIIDHDGGAQPLFSEDGQIVLVLNGEIYNHVELRDDLVRRGHRFSTRSDAEVLVHLYEDKGFDAVSDLRGMFAFALWDRRTGRLLLGRDRMGEKPIYLVESDGRLVFASELKALVAAGAAPLELDLAAVNRYFHYAYVPEPQTTLHGVRKLPAASLLVVQTRPWSVRTHVYWRMLDAPPVDADPLRAIRSVLEEGAELIVRADVPVGVALSGGLDSSAVAALAARAAPGAIHAFSVGYPGRPTYDERRAAEALAEALGMPYHDVEVDLEDMLEAFPAMVGWRDDPIADIAGHGYYAVARAARRAGVPVLLQGQGGDELFWGYALTRDGLAYSRDRLARQRWGALAFPRYLRSTIRSAREANRPLPWRKALASAHRRWRRDADCDPDSTVFYDTVPDFVSAPAALRQVAAEEFLRAVDASDPLDLHASPPADGRLDLQITERICATYLRENGLTQGDRLAMASGVELRLPLLDHRLVELVIGLRKLRRDDRLAPKAWLRAAVADLLPLAVLNRPKQGFSPPLRTWHNALFKAYGEMLRDGRLVERGVLSAEGAAELSAGAFPGHAVTPFSFKALVLEMWIRAMETWPRPRGGQVERVVTRGAALQASAV